MSSEPAGGLPSLGPKPQHRWGARTAKRKDQLQIWSAVALQQHFARGARVQATLPSLEELPPPLPGGRLTLAQKMGLVPRPPPEPSEEEWTRIEGAALRRGTVVPTGANACCICQEPFYATMEQGQVLLSCSHVFHEQCFRRFEKFARQSRGREDITPLSCPVCRSSHYHKRVFYAGKAMAQRAAIVKIQAFFRRVLARKAYLKLRLEKDSNFSGEYARERLARLSDAYTAYAERREREQSNMLENISLRLQRALADCTTKEEWATIRKRVEEALLSSETALECPICLCSIEKNPNSEEIHKSTIGEDVVAALRRDYEARMSQRNSSINNNNNNNNSKRNSQLGPRQKRDSSTKINSQQQQKQHKNKQKLKQQNGGQEQKEKYLRSPPQHSSSANNNNNNNTIFSSCIVNKGCVELPMTASNGPRYGVLLSCGHCFHDVCLSAFERYTEMMAIQWNNDSLIPRCPMCRSAYVKADY